MRRVVSLVAGLLCGGIVVAFIEGLSTILHPMPENLDRSSIEAMKEFVVSLPLSAFLLVLAAHFCGALTAGCVCIVVMNQFWWTGPLIVGGVFLCAGVMNLIMIPHPMWFGIADVLIYLPAAALGALTAKRFVEKGESSVA